MESIDWEMYKDQYERPLGPLEKATHVMRGACTPMINALGVTSSVPVTEEAVNKALVHLINCQTMLRMCIKRRRNGCLYFCKVEDDVIKKVSVQLRSEKDWKTVVDDNRDINTFANERDLLWKCILMPNACLYEGSTIEGKVHNCVIIFIQDHSINDGVGTVELMKKFMFFLNEVLNDRDIETRDSPPVMPEEYHLYKKYPIKPSQAAMVLFKQTMISFNWVISLTIWLLHNLVKTQFSQHVGLEMRKNPNCERAAKVELHVLNKDDTTKLVMACKKNGCTVQGAIQAAANSALGSILNDHGAAPPFMVKNHVPLDLRRRLIEDGREFQCTVFSGSVPIEAKLEENVYDKSIEGLWKLAVDSTRAVHSEVDKKQYVEESLNHPFFYTMFNANPQRMSEATCVASTNTLVVSSLGTFEFPDSSTTIARPSGFMFSLTGGPLFALYVATINGQMSLSYTYFTQVTSPALAKQFCTKCLEVLKRFIECGETGNKI